MFFNTSQVSIGVLLKIEAICRQFYRWLSGQNTICGWPVFPPSDVKRLKLHFLLSQYIQFVKYYFVALLENNLFWSYRFYKHIVFQNDSFKQVNGNWVNSSDSSACSNSNHRALLLPVSLIYFNTKRAWEREKRGCEGATVYSYSNVNDQRTHSIMLNVTKRGSF